MNILYFDLLTILIFVILWIFIALYLRSKKKKGFVYLLFFTVFYIYLFKVLDHTLFQFQSLIIMKYFMPNLMLRGETAGESMNIIPLITLTLEDLKTSLLNILLFVPFGLGLPFITNARMKKVVILGAIFSIAIEILQFVTGLMAKITFRVADINDVIFNTAGAAIGYMLFLGFVYLIRHISHNKKNLILRYIADRPQIK